ncbi:MAG: polysaccharide deacetylase family protein [Verrucomicrobiota bacterium]
MISQPVRTVLLIALSIFPLLSLGGCRGRGGSDGPAVIVSDESKPDGQGRNSNARARRAIEYDGPVRRNPDIVVRGNYTPDGRQITWSRANVPGPFVALTFDDGPHPTNTPRLLDILKRRNITATFFVVGSNTNAYPGIIRRMVAEGHEVANHTVNHPNLTQLSQNGVRRELDGSRDAIQRACGVTPTLMRPPYGALSRYQRAWIMEEYRYPTILWDVDPRDWTRPGAAVVADRIVKGTRNGSIILAHDIHAPTIDAMPSTLDRLLGKGFRFVTVSELLALHQASAPTPEATGTEE